MSSPDYLCIVNLTSPLNIPLHMSGLSGTTKKQNTQSIKNTIESVNWKILFNNKTVNKQVSIFIMKMRLIFFSILVSTNLLHFMMIMILTPSQHS